MWTPSSWKTLMPCACVVAGFAVAHAEVVPPQGIERLGFMEGRWNLRTEAIVDGDWQEVRRQAVDVHRVLDDRFLRFTFLSDYADREFLVEVTLSFDNARGIYRMSFNTSFAGYMDLYEGDFADGALQMSNERTGTGLPVDRGLQHARFAFRQTSEDGFAIEVSFSDDGGKMWQDYQRLYFRRAAG